MKIISIDPGVMTGYCIANLEPTKWLKYKPAQMVDDVDDLWKLLVLWQPRYIIIEDFEYRNKARSGLNLFPVQLIGVTRLYSILCKHQCSVELQKASTGKSYYTDLILKQAGLYKKGMPHAMDASRHLLHWVTFGFGYQFNGNKEIEKFATLVDDVNA